MNTEELIELIKIKTIKGELPLTVTGIQMNSKRVEPGNLFICITGHTVDGHDFVDEAIRRGAKIIIAEKAITIDFSKVALVIVKDSAKVMARLANHFFDYPVSRLLSIGITGTNGKTSVSHLVHDLLLLSNYKSAACGSLGFYIDEKFIPTQNTTSDILSNLEMAQQALDHGCETMTFEISSHGLVHGRVWGIDMDIAVFTNLSQDHLDYHGTMERYGHAKGLLFAQLGQNLRTAKYVVLNADDPWYRRFSQMTPFEVISYGIFQEADFYAAHIRCSEHGTEFSLHSPEGIFPVKTNFIGEFNVYNVLAAVATLYASGHEIDTIIKKLSFVFPVKGRMEKLDYPAGPTVYIDYAHTPDAIEKAIHSVIPYKKGRLIVLIAGGSHRDTSKRPIMAAKASVADYVIITVNNPGTEIPSKIVSDFEKGMQHTNYITIPDRTEAVRHAIQIAESRDTILLTDKGHETTLLIDTEWIPYNDEKIAREQLELLYGPINTGL
ncbi:UDP-N-acetylmuramoyl-L-alanyl-D-glutamate--2,6-diaminopimelate ligase [Virgibacillus sp. SK37]|uniref:UDP-N-acetylmuramoyl-L-alanyl-D-glutamate--2, 6-diaminopimelate ligase n=1 Tax=Virgibacillus sp. SK37 TaxID=403957 RepID=UPI0004D12C6C|nr:UDP-N-acetylmuramoyl-L-alanyl-D-glutamate--2,6-diaminopimelate ligase [Virgibacillus sp. SK37]AIF42912.1 UDP-N-acetylmuramyl peptide synthase [Virgibacillus sp. SK37]